MVLEQDVLDSLIQENKIHEELITKAEDFNRTINRGYSRVLFLLAGLSLLGALSFYTYFIFWEEKWGLYTALGIVALFFILMRLSSVAQIFYSRHHFAQLINFLKDRPLWSKIIFPTNLEPMRRAYLYKELLPTITSLSCIERKGLIDKYRNEGEQHKNNKKYLITLLGVMQFAVWTGYISAVIEMGGTLGGMTLYLLIFMLVSLAITVYVYAYKNVLERAFLKTSNQYFLLAEIITRINMLEEVASQQSSTT